MSKLGILETLDDEELLRALFLTDRWVTLRTPTE